MAQISMSLSLWALPKARWVWTSTSPGMTKSPWTSRSPAAGRDIGYGQMEKLANLEQLPDHGFLVSCFPYKIRHASAGFVRAVAILE